MRFMNDLDVKINKLLETISNIVVGEVGDEEALGFQFWPFHPIYGRLFFASEWFERFYSVLKEIKEKQTSNEEIAKLFKASSRIVQMFWMLGSIKQSKLSERERIWTVEQLLNLLSIYRREDVFCENGKNIIIGDLEKVEKIGKEIELKGIAGENLFKLLYSLEGILLMYTELIYFMEHPLGHSFHGPYQINDKELIIRKYFDLKPEFWPFTQKLIFKEIEIQELYSEDTNIRFDFFEKGFETPTPYRNKLIKFRISVDNKQLTTQNELKNVLNNLNEVAQRGTQYIQTLKEKDLIIKFAESWFYPLKPLCDFLDKDWYPPKEVYDNVYKKFDQFNKIWENMQKRWQETANMTREQKIDVFKRSFDPRD